MVEFKDKEIERFILKFRNEEQLKLWETTLNKTRSQPKSHVPNTHLLSMSTPATPTHTNSDIASYIDDEDEDEDEEEDEEDEYEDDFNTTRSRSNSLSAQQVLNGMRPSMLRKSSQDAATWKANNGTASGGRSMPGMNLSPLPRTPDYPASPPPSSPSSPSSRASTSSAASSWHRRNDDASPLVDIASKFMTSDMPPDEYRPAPIGRSQSHSAAAPGMPPVPSQQQQQQQPPMPLHHTRVRSQSSPNIHKNAQQWEQMPQVPINSRTLYTKANSDRANGPSAPRLSEMASSLQSQIDRVVSAVPNSPGTFKVKLSYNDGIYVIVVPEEIGFAELMERVEKKIRLVANLKQSDVLRLKYQDEDGDLITINSDDDVQMAFENRNAHSAVNLFVTV